MLLIGRKLTNATKRRSGSFRLDQIQDTADQIQDRADEIQDTADQIQDTALPCPYLVRLCGLRLCSRDFNRRMTFLSGIS